MTKKPILIICGEPNSIFSEIIIKSFKKYKSKKPLLLIGSHNLMLSQLKKMKIKTKLNLIKLNSDLSKQLDTIKINILNVDYKFKKPFEKISSKSNRYIEKCFDVSFKIIASNKISGLINGPISKKFFLGKKHQGITEYLAKKFKLDQNFAMLIYNKNFSVSPVTTHIPINLVKNRINKKLIVTKCLLISKFYKKFFNRNSKIAVCGLNPHCENFFELSEEKKIIEPAIKYLRKRKINIDGPMPADTIFLEQNLTQYDVILGMYHDQVLAPIKALNGFDAINLTLGLPFIRISPDHGPNTNMLGKNKSSPKSLIESIKFLNKF